MVTTTNALLSALTPLPLALTLPTSPTIASILGSKHNVYLANCDPNECPIGACDPGDFHLTAAIYFSSGSVSGTGTNRPTGLGKLSGSNTKWEGAKRTARFDSDIGLSSGTFVSQIDKAAATAASGSLAGNGTLTVGGGLGGGSGDGESFACFKDGTSKFVITYDTDRYTCTTDYWCGSLDTGSS